MAAQLMGETVKLSEARGRVINRMGNLGQYKVRSPRTGQHDQLVIDILREAGPLSTPELFEETVLAGHPVVREALLKVCEKLMDRGVLTREKRPRGNGAGKGVSVWSVAIT